MKRKILILLTLLSAGSLYAFDYASYKFKDLDEIVCKSKFYDPERTEGQSLLIPPPRIHLFEKLIRYPFKCDGQPIEYLLMVATRLPIEKIPSVNMCMQIESRNGEKIVVFIQDSISEYVQKEYELGQKIHLWASWLFVNSSDKKPYFVVNGIGPPEDAEQVASPEGGTYPKKVDTKT